MSSARCPLAVRLWEKHSAPSRTFDRRQKLVRLPTGTGSPSDRNAVRHHQGMLFGFTPESRSPSTNSRPATLLGLNPRLWDEMSKKCGQCQEFGKAVPLKRFGQKTGRLPAMKECLASSTALGAGDSPIRWPAGDRRSFFGSKGGSRGVSLCGGGAPPVNVDSRNFEACCSQSRCPTVNSLWPSVAKRGRVHRRPFF
jgi:hypothetical protein